MFEVSEESFQRLDDVSHASDGYQRGPDGVRLHVVRVLDGEVRPMRKLRKKIDETTLEEDLLQLHSGLVRGKRVDVVHVIVVDAEQVRVRQQD